jgi:coenzyme F420-0:L-glutamate ligase
LELFGLKSEQFVLGDPIEVKLSKALSVARLKLRNSDIIAVTSKVVSLSERNVVSLASVKPSARAKKLGEKLGMVHEFVQIVLNEADAVYGGVSGAILTIKNGDAIANSGVDRKNAPSDHVVPWPVNPQHSANRIRRALKRKLRKNIGVVIVDSRVTPLRLGTTGLAIACSGFQPVRDYRGVKDIYGRQTRITLQAIADGIAAAAHVLMGEARESVPFVLVRDAPIRLGRGNNSYTLTISTKNCLYMSQMPRPFQPRVAADPQRMSRKENRR